METVVAFSTIALALITGLYAYATFRILKANEAVVGVMRNQAEALTRPYIVIAPFVREGESLFYLRIENIGRAAAENLRLSIDRDFFQWGERARPENNLATMSAFKEPITSFPPGAKLVFGLAQGFVLFADTADDQVNPKRFRVTASYSYPGRSVTETTNVDLWPYLSSTREPAPLLEELQKIREALEKAAR